MISCILVFDAVINGILREDLQIMLQFACVPRIGDNIIFSYSGNAQSCKVQSVHHITALVTEEASGIMLYAESVCIV